MATRRLRVRARGVVQGVGFRPFVFRLAQQLDLDGHVRNDAHGVLIEVEGDTDVVARFVEALPRAAPPLARVEEVLSEEIPVTGARGFAILASGRDGGADTPVTPDAATCDACLAELLDPGDRRHRHPFLNCTNCGPRFTIVRDVPYDRPATTMAEFAMCAACQAEYDDPGDRRFHAQANACPDCGPHAWLAAADGGVLVEGRRDEAVVAAAAALDAGAIVAIKGLGGFHLACRADDSAAVAALRARKARLDKPFALMAADATAAGELVDLDAPARALLLGPARPIVVAPRRPGARVASDVAPRTRELGVMLPYTPLHHLLLRACGGPLVLTSGNVSDEPIAYRDADALERLAPIADRFLLHDRPIHVRADDSVVRVAAGRPAVLRRSRGEVPGELALPVAARRPLLAVGAQLKSTFCLARDRRAWLGHHIGDLDSWEVLRAFRAGIDHFERLFAVAPQVVAHDLHPDYLSTAEALAREGLEAIGVQHHHAHLAACLAEHGETGPAVGAIYDGVGLGDDGGAWGGELLVGDLRGFRRAGHLAAVALPGGDAAAREPWRMACAWLVAAGGGAEPALPGALAAGVAPERWRAVARMAATGTASPATTSVGRLFDAVAALCGFAGPVRYEGQAAIELEACADDAERGAYPLALATDATGALVLDARETVLAAARDVAAGVSPGIVSARLHRGLAAATAEACARVAADAGIGTVVLSGGVFQNARLLAGCAEGLQARGLRVLVPRRVPANDGGISFGQAAVAAARDAA